MIYDLCPICSAPLILQPGSLDEYVHYSCSHSQLYMNHYGLSFEDNKLYRETYNHISENEDKIFYVSNYIDVNLTKNYNLIMAEFDKYSGYANSKRNKRNIAIAMDEYISVSKRFSFETYFLFS